MVYVLYNPLAGNHTGRQSAQALADQFPQESVTFQDTIDIKDVYSFLAAVEKTDRVIIAGGDGTLNRLANDLNGRVPPCPVYYFPVGSGNDFYADRKQYAENGLILLNPYLRDLPTVTVQGKTHRFLNGIGYGIDGYCCEVGDKLRERTNKPVNYAKIAIQGLLFHFRPASAVVTVDGVKRTYRKVWLAPTMNGRFYGGGMMIAPDQNRANTAHELSLVLIHDSGKFKTLVVFPSIFKGKHTSHTEMVDVLTGHDITVEFDRPTALQIDGETVSGVTSYHCVSAKVPAKV